jgi:hypothetical protein
MPYDRERQFGRGLRGGHPTFVTTSPEQRYLSASAVPALIVSLSCKYNFGSMTIWQPFSPGFVTFAQVSTMRAWQRLATSGTPWQLSKRQF